MQYVILIFIVVGFIALVWLMTFNYAKGKSQKKPEPAKKEEKPVEKPKEEGAKEEKKEDIPEILKEVTRGNYMYETSKLSEEDQLQVEMVENSEIQKGEEEPFRVTLGEILADDENLALNTRDILDEMDAELEENSANETEEARVKTLGEEIKELSPRMKAILISDILNKNNDNTQK